jgi:hypothetical protein
MKPALNLDELERNREWIRNIPERPLKDREKNPDKKKEGK